MSWIDKLMETYDLNAGSNGLIPLFHTEMNAQLIVSLDNEGRFADARIITEKKAQSRIIPCTENSASRTAACAPHPLFDSLQYIAGDLFCGPQAARIPKKDCSRKATYFDAYFMQLDAWCKSAAAIPEICIVRDYLSRRTLACDLIRKNILPVDAAGAVLIEKPKGEHLSPEETAAVSSPVFPAVTGDLTKLFVLFEIFYPGRPACPLWNNPAVQESWQKYYLDVLGKTAPRGFCQILGREAPLARLHPKRICNAGDNAKIISGNDAVNFTYRGRFEDPMEASAISIEASQKAHSALRWILAKQGTHEASQYMVAWAADKAPEVPCPVLDTADLLEEDPFAEVSTPEKQLPDTAVAEAAALNRMIAGYSAKLNARGLCFMVLDAATPGTLAVKLFRDLDGALYLKNILHWHTTCAWLQRFSKDKKFYGAPAPRDMAYAAYGSMKMDDPRIRSTVARLLPCILDAAPIPMDIARCIIERASKYESVEPWEFNKNLGIACSVFRYNNQHRRQYTMALDRTIHSRDYLYGRLLAVADYLEYSALSSSETNRSTNAMRLMAHFSEHPFSTWRNMEMALNPYKIRLAANQPGKLVMLEALLGEIHQAFDAADFMNNRPLSGEYLLGYYCQKADFFTRKDEKNINTENN